MVILVILNHSRIDLLLFQDCRHWRQSSIHAASLSSGSLGSLSPGSRGSPLGSRLATRRDRGTGGPR
jgi:hypothetical protein